MLLPFDERKSKGSQPVEQFLASIQFLKAALLFEDAARFAMFCACARATSAICFLCECPTATLELFIMREAENAMTPRKAEPTSKPTSEKPF
jgi:hypothetical protein